MTLIIDYFIIETCCYASNKYDLKEKTGSIDKNTELPVYRTISYGSSFLYLIKKIARAKLNDVKFEDINKMLSTFEATINEVIAKIEKQLDK